MGARMTNPAQVLPGAMEAIRELAKVAQSSGVPSETLELAHLRASQINGCSFCVGLAGRGEKVDQRLWSAVAWRDAPFYTEAERAVLALAEAMTRLADAGDAVPDELWDAVAKHYDERQLAGLVLWISITNLFNRINVTTRQPSDATLPA
ncbi:carboxymuconolactone decarboxylase family protein [Pseudonocardia acaciae]|uniref:carboxymuconolactone decarboxylase family protein n=1 Tax=Pseudonocardia acaciae TaxID=551276 RepID=UPI00048F1B15|nr:carboxymuconolactone decarboxylase family protein [Pseudonocardia acaciae]